jgi:hypothetical protein
VLLPTTNINMHNMLKSVIGETITVRYTARKFQFSNQMEESEDLQ